MDRALRNALFGLACFSVAPAAHAAACAGTSPFADVAPTDIFCSDTEWMRNRGISTGCGGLSYCPDHFVTRGQMALFMQRLGTALAPVATRTEALPGAIDLDTESFFCMSPVHQYDDIPAGWCSMRTSAVLRPAPPTST